MCSRARAHFCMCFVVFSISQVTGATCGVVPRRQADGFFEEAELGVVEPKRLVDHVRRRLHVHPQDGHQLAVFGFKCNLLKEGGRLGRSPNFGSRTEKVNKEDLLYSDQMVSQSVFNWPEKNKQTKKNRTRRSQEQMASAPGCYDLIVPRQFCLILLPWLTLF